MSWQSLKNLFSRPKPRRGPVDPTDALLQLFQAHDLPSATRHENYVLLPHPTHPKAATATIVSHNQHPTGHVVQLDVRFSFAPGQVICESFAGVGRTRSDAVVDALTNFTNGTLHVLLAAFLDRPSNQVDVEHWTVDHLPRTVTLGGLTLRGAGGPPLPGPEAAALIQDALALVKSSPLPPGTHWLRLFLSQDPAGHRECEALLDNTPWPQIQQQLPSLPWPPSPGFYSLRLFLVIQDASDQTP